MNKLIDLFCALLSLCAAISLLLVPIILGWVIGHHIFHFC